ncbi:MAG TPA: translation initiation factor IF-3 [Candidatus Pacearchaeota archaeon]|nr:translation initiation factor IF-3 [Candidatus Pacearchaeota archaeon]
MIKPLVNQQIRAREVRVVDEQGVQLGVVPTREALRMAEERNLDLIQVTEKVDPPVCRIGDYGKYLYSLKKKDKNSKVKTGELKSIRLSFNISDNDLKTRANNAIKFLKNKEKVKIDLRLKGREKGLEGVGKEKINKLIEIIQSQEIEIKIEKELKKEPKGLSMIISKK